MDLGEEEYAAQYEVEDLLKMVGEGSLRQKWSNLDDSSPSQADHGIERNGRETDDQEDRRHQLQVLLRQTRNRSFPSGMKREFSLLQTKQATQSCMIEIYLSLENIISYFIHVQKSMV